MHGGNGEELGIIANDGLPFLTFQEEVELLDERLGARVGVDDVYGAQKGIICRGNIILEGPHIACLLTALSANLHNANGKVLEGSKHAVNALFEPVSADYANNVGVTLHHFDNGAVRSVIRGKHIARYVAAGAEAVFHKAHGA